MSNDMKEDEFWGVTIFCFACVLIGAFTAYVVFPLYLHLDLVRNVGMSTARFIDQESKLFLQICLFCGATCVLLPGFLLARTLKSAWRQTLVPLAVSLFWPWSLLCLLAALGGTVSDGLWYRGVLNAVALLSLPFLNWFLALTALWTLRKQKMLN